MPDPSVVTCTANTWIKVIGPIKECHIHRINTDIDFLQTYRMEDDPAPADDTDAVRAFQDNNTEIFNVDNDIDIYFKALNYDGKVRVDVLANSI